MGLIIPGYVIEELIEKGGLAWVYRVKRVIDKKVLAIKILSPESAQQATNKRLFFREVKLLTRLNHPYIIKSEGAEPKAPRPAMVMEYFPGQTLKSLIRAGSAQEQHPLIQNKGIGIFRKSLEAVQYLHQHKIIHKDIKPENILVMEEGDLRLIDFNIAEKESIFSFLKKKKIEGTVLYISPEQVLRKRLDCRSDIYALGATFYEVFAGKAHISATSEKGLLQKHLKASVPNIRHIKKNVPYQLDNIIMRMLEKKRENRYQTISEVLFDLNKFTDRESLAPSG